MPIAEVLWHCAALNSAEHCVLSETETGWQIRGLTVTPIDVGLVTQYGEDLWRAAARWG